jgi:hypothetical protein
MITQEEFIKRCKDTHGNKYDYSKSIFISYNDKVTITCKKHGDFEIIVNNFLTHSRNCKKCGDINKSKTKLKIGREKYIFDVKEAYNDLYSFDKLEFRGILNEVILTCNHHGHFKTIARNVLRGKGCPECYPRDYNNFKFKNWKAICINNKAYLYLLNIYNENESFFKIGITKHKNINRRYSGFSKTGYKLEMLSQIEDTPENIWTSEKLLIKYLKNFHYIPNNKFLGSSTECFKIEKI